MSEFLPSVFAILGGPATYLMVRLWMRLANIKDGPLSFTACMFAGVGVFVCFIGTLVGIAATGFQLGKLL